MTVSRALSGHPNVNAKTRARILARAAELNYVPSAAARAMRGGQTRIIGLLLPNLTNAFYAGFADALARLCGAAGFHLSINLTNDRAEDERDAIKRLRELEAFALVMVPTGDDDPHLADSLGNMEIVQLVRQSALARPAAYLAIDESSALQQAIKRLRDAGHHRIGYIGADAALSSGAGRLEAFDAGIAAAGINADPDLAFLERPSFETGAAGVAHLLAKSDPPTALVTGGFEISNGALEACLERDIAIPEQLSFVGFGDSSFYRWVNGGITTIGLPVNEMAATAVRHLSAAAAHEPLEPLPLHAAELITRRSA